MLDPTSSPENAGRPIRDLENARAWDRSEAEARGLEGLREYSDAWYENRSTAYLLRKSWADPVNRWLLIAVLAVIAGGWIFLLSL